MEERAGPALLAVYLGCPVRFCVPQLSSQLERNF